MMQLVRAVGEYLATNMRKTPLFMWLYLAVVLFMFRRVTRDFLGMGLRKKRILGRSTVALTRDEESIADCIVDPSALRDSFATVGGLEAAKQALTESVVWPFRHPELFPPGALQSHPTGVLLHGPPGTGKTLLARALAKELDGHFIEVRVERLFSKFVGESEKLAAAFFSLAEKLQPAVIFVDELDALLCHRSDADSAVYMHAKTIFLTKWDGLVGGNNRILVVGATNRMHALDAAVLRRLPIRLAIGAPDEGARRSILEVLLRDQLSPAAAGARSAIGDELDVDALDLDAVARWTDGLVGSDLRELCKAAGVIAMRRVMQQREATASSPTSSPAAATASAAPGALRLRTEHFAEALKRTKR